MEQKIIFRKIEEILYSYTKYKKRIQTEYENLKDLQIKQSYKIKELSGHSFEFKSELEKLEDLRNKICKNIERYNEMIYRIDECLNLVVEHKDYGFIKLRYFDKKSYEDIAGELEINVSNAYKMRNRILGALEIHMITQKLICY